MHKVVSRLALSVTATSLLAGALVAVGATSADAAPQRPAADAPDANGGYSAVAPSLAFDSRSVRGVPANGTRTFTLTGVPTGATAVALNVTALAPAAAGYFTLYTGSTRPASVGSLNFPAGRKISNTAVVPLNGQTQVTVYNGTATKAVDAIVVVTGWFTGVQGTPAGAFHALTAPTRIVDSNSTRPVAPVTTAGSVPAGGYRSYQVAGAHDIPSTAGAVVANVSVVAGTAAGYVTVGTGSTKPPTNLVNLVPGQTLGTLSVLKLDADGDVSVFNASGTPVRVLVDVAGYLDGDAARFTGQLSALPPARVVDTTKGTGTPEVQVPAGGSLSVVVGGRGGVPKVGAATAAVTITAANAKAAGYLTAYQPGTARPGYSTLAFPAGVTTPGAAIVGLQNGAFTVFNGATSPVDVVVDVEGFVRSTDLTVPSTSTSRYVNDLLSADSTATITSKMDAHGCDDATALTDADPHVALLEFGAQSNKVPSGTSTTTGVLPPNTQGNSQRLTYAQVVTAVKGYLGGLSRCTTEDASGPFTVAVGTSSDGYRGATYTPAAKGADWASKVIAPLQSAASAASVGLVGANDIEPNFDATAAEVGTWVQNFLAGNSLQFVNNGAAPNCPTTFGQINTTCQPVAPDDPSNPAQTWTQAQYASFSRGLGPTRISVLPQIYDDQSAVRWENISLTAASTTGGPLRFTGVLTQDGACDSGCGLTPPAGWVAMRQALDGSAVTSGTTLPAVTDIRYDS